jgi:hypothetical protein
MGSTLERGQYQDKGPHWLSPQVGAYTGNVLSQALPYMKDPPLTQAFLPYTLSKGKDPAAYLRQAFPRFLWL